MNTVALEKSTRLIGVSNERSERCKSVNTLTHMNGTTKEMNQSGYVNALVQVKPFAQMRQVTVMYEQRK